MTTACRIQPRIHRPRLLPRLSSPSPAELILAAALLPLVLCVGGALLVLWPLCRLGTWYEGLCPDCLEPVFRCRCMAGEGRASR